MITDDQFQKLLGILGQIGSQAYAAALQQVNVDAHLDLFWGIIFSVGIVIGIIVVIFGIRLMDEDSDTGSGVSLFGLLITIFTVLLASINFSNAYSLSVSPQWQAIQYLAKLVK